MDLSVDEMKEKGCVLKKSVRNLLNCSAKESSGMGENKKKDPRTVGKLILENMKFKRRKQVSHRSRRNI